MGVKMQKKVFLLTKANEIEFENIEDNYDDGKNINMIKINGESLPFILNEFKNPTDSKTAQYPGDDDPDPDDERCY